MNLLNYFRSKQKSTFGNNSSLQKLSTSEQLDDSSVRSSSRRSRNSISPITSSRQKRVIMLNKYVKNKQLKIDVFEITQALKKELLMMSLDIYNTYIWKVKNMEMQKFSLIFKVPRSIKMLKKSIATAGLQGDDQDCASPYLENSPSKFGSGVAKSKIISKFFKASSNKTSTHIL